MLRQPPLGCATSSQACARLLQPDFSFCIFIRVICQTFHAIFKYNSIQEKLWQHSRYCFPNPDRISTICESDEFFTLIINYLISLYLSKFRKFTKILYGSPSPRSAKSKYNVLWLEGIQRSASKFILHYLDLGYKERLTQLNIFALATRREIYDLTFFF